MILLYCFIAYMLIILAGSLLIRLIKFLLNKQVEYGLYKDTRHEKNEISLVFDLLFIPIFNIGVLLYLFVNVSIICCEIVISNAFLKNNGSNPFVLLYKMFKKLSGG